MKIYSDGYCIGSNPSKVGGGYSIVDENNKLLETKEVFKEGFTNNEAELLGCVRAMELANIGDTIIVDSMNTIHWINGAGKHKNKNKRQDLQSIKVKGFYLRKEKALNLIWEGRDSNLAGQYNEFVLKKDSWLHSKLMI